MKAILKFEKNKYGTNELLEGDGFFVSYNGNVKNVLGFPMFSGDGSSETALTIGTGPFLILNGDFREEYLAAAERSLEAVKAVYDSHKGECRSSWSEDAI